MIVISRGSDGNVTTTKRFPFVHKVLIYRVYDTIKLYEWYRPMSTER